jgi:patatin-related protein
MSIISNLEDTMTTIEQKNVTTAGDQLQPAPEIKRETRFAVVMYGGVSLAIYIYGVAKELYSMVRATARTKSAADGKEYYLLNDGQLSDVERVYRKLGVSLGTKFVVDILSGTSAGGINAIYLAKALVNGQSLNLLKDVWLEQGDISNLINDKDSVIRGLEPNNPPRSLLNSPRMYYFLLKALHDMDKEKDRIASPDGLSPFVEELDLNITATDIRGLHVDLPISNARVQELKYRHVFRFHYSTMEAAGWESESAKKAALSNAADTSNEYSNDFIQDNNPFLAYVARCTSSFPFAFEPMRLDDIKHVLKLRDFEGNYKYTPERWDDFYKDYSKAGDEFPIRSFGDGGYIDNKPFSYATEALLRRRADQPVDRKLIYIDPSPEHPEISPNGERPDALQNVMAALLSIPRYEPIREDLERVIERNRLIARMNEVIRHIDFVPGLKKEVKEWQKNPSQWAGKFFDKELIDWLGISYATYHQLRVASVLENLNTTFLRAFKWEESGGRADDFQVLMEGWRHHYYAVDPQLAATHWSENDILFRLDTTWRMRRIVFLQNIINTLLQALPSDNESPASDPHELEKAIAQANQILKTGKIRKAISSFKSEELRKELTAIKYQINDAYGHLRARGRKARSRTVMSSKHADTDMQNYVGELTGLKALLDGSQLKELAKEAQNILEKNAVPSPALAEVFAQIERTTSALAEHLPNKERRGYVCQTMSNVSRIVITALGGRAPKEKAKDARTPIQKCLSHYHDTFEYYDMLIFPVYYGTNVGESDETEIIRISPEDADSLVNEKGNSKRKLAGTTLMNFGAFFAREWRENDMLWGRLDAAECVIKAIMQESEERDTILHDVQAAILQEDLTPRDEAEVYRARNETEKAEREKLLTDKYKERYELQENEKDSLKVTLRRLFKPEKTVQLFKQEYKVDRGFPPAETLMASSRALRVVGYLLDGLAKTHENFSAPAKVLTSAGSIFAGILSVALPNSLGNFLFGGYWVWLLYVFEILLVAAGWLTGSDGMKQFGILSFIITFLTHLLLLVLNDRLKGKRGWLRLPILVIFGVLGIGALLFASFLMYVGLLDIGLLSLPTGPFGAWIAQFID